MPEASLPWSSHGLTRVTVQVTPRLVPLEWAARVAPVKLSADTAAIRSALVSGPRLLEHPVTNPFPLRHDRRHLLHEIPHRPGELHLALPHEIIGDLAPAADYLAPGLEQLSLPGFWSDVPVDSQVARNVGRI